MLSLLLYWKIPTFLPSSRSAWQRAVVNLDDEAAQAMAEAADEVPLVTYSFSNPDADVRATSVKFSIWETELTIETPLGILKIVTPLIGRPNVYNILACVAACISIDVDLKVVAAALENAEVRSPTIAALSARFSVHGTLHS